LKYVDNKQISLKLHKMYVTLHEDLNIFTFDVQVSVHLDIIYENDQQDASV